MAEWVAGRALPSVSAARAEEAAKRLTAPLGAAGTPVYPLLARLRSLMWEWVGLIRDRTGLESALAEIAEIEERGATVAVPGGPEDNLAWQDWLNLQSMTTAARLIARSALERTESRGSHYRRDFPQSDPRWLVNVLVQAKDGEVSVGTEPVRFKRARPDSREPQTAAVEIGD